MAHFEFRIIGFDIDEQVDWIADPDNDRETKLPPGLTLGGQDAKQFIAGHPYKVVETAFTKASSEGWELVSVTRLEHEVVSHETWHIWVDSIWRRFVGD